MGTTMDGRYLYGIRVSGSEWTGQLEQITTKVTFAMSVDAVTTMKFQFVDDYQLTLFRSRLMDQGATITYAEWKLTVDSVDVSPSDVGPILDVQAESGYVYKLQKQFGAKTWTNADVSQWFRDRISEAGARPVVEPGLGTKTIVRESNLERGFQNTWEVMSQVKREVGVWMFERGHQFIVGRPSWVVRQIGIIQEWPFYFEDWFNYSPALMGLPTYSGRNENAQDERLSFRLLSGDADKIRPGDVVHMNGYVLGPMGGGWVVSSVSFPMNNIEPVSVECVRIHDPAKETATESTGLGNATAAAAAGQVNAATRPADTIALTNLPTAIAGYSGTQLINAAHIITAANAAALPLRAAQIAVMTAIGESALRVLNYGTGSVPSARGIFQQPDTGWGTYECRMDPSCSASTFYNRLRAVSGWASMEPTQAAHAVQGNADPLYYRQFWPAAVAVVESILATATNSGGVALGAELPASLSAAVDRYVRSVLGRPIDFDKAHGAQCTDLAQHYTVAMGGPKIWGNGRDWWVQGRASGFYVGVSRDTPGRKGDVACWGATGNGGEWGHVAPVLQDQGTTLRCLSQNPGPPTIVNISKAGLDW